MKLRVDQVWKTHLQGTTELSVLRGLSAEFPAGSFSFLLGPSGSGKSTLLYLLGGLDDPTSGQIYCEDQAIQQWSEQRRDQFRRHEVGFIFQSFNLLSTLDAVENVLVPYTPTGTSSQQRDEAVDLLKRVGLGDRLTHRPNQLSGGEQQRVAIARALLKKPKLILADEPTGELDSQTGKEVFGYLRELAVSVGATVIVVTHDSRFIESEDRVLKIRDGLIET